MDSRFDVVVLGTGLTESIAAAALSKAGLKVVHIDRQPFYGGTEASLTTNELHEWASQHASHESPNSCFCAASTRGDAPSSSRSYSLSLAPSVIVSTGSLISSLIASGVSRYGGFKLLEHLFIYSDAQIKTVPGSKEDIFKSKEISLIDKRRLMRFLLFASGDFEASNEISGREQIPFRTFLKEVFSLNDELSSAITFALALCSSDSEPTLTALTRIKTHLRSAGRYGPSPFLVGHYGGLGELAQGYCRVCAVSGGIYILGREVTTLTKLHQEDGAFTYRLSLEGLEESVEGKFIIASSDYQSLIGQLNIPRNPELPPGDGTAYCVAVISGPLHTTAPKLPESSEPGAVSPEDDVNPRPLDTALIVFPPNSLSSGKCSQPVNVLINGEGTLSCPRDQCVLYLTVASGTNESPEELLSPYLDATLSLLRTTSNALPSVRYSAFYRRNGPSGHGIKSQIDQLKEHNIILCSPLSSHLAMNGDAASSEAERVFRAAIEVLGSSDAQSSDSMWPLLSSNPDDDDDD